MAEQFSVMSTRISRISRIPSVSRPLIGSSRMSRAGLPNSAIAMPIRCFIPREHFLNFVLASPSMRTIFSTRRISRSGSAKFRLMACIIRFWYTLEPGKHPAFSISAPTRTRTPGSV